MDTGSLRDLSRRDGPFVSVYFDSGPLLDLRWRAIRDQLEAQAAAGISLDALDVAVLAEPPPGLPGRALIVSGDEVLLDRHLPLPPAGYTARVSELPYLLPLVDLAEPLVPHVIVHVDEQGADLRGVDRSGRSVAVATVGARYREGEHRPRAEELADITEEAVRLVAWLDAPLLVLAGPVIPRRALRNVLPPSHWHLVVELDTGHRSSVDDLGVERAIQHLASRGNQDERRDAVTRFRDESTRLTGLAVHGLRAVTAALDAGSVDTLLLSGPLVGDRIDERTGRRADEVLPHAAVSTGADIVLVGGDLRLHEDVGALLQD
jgi:hypothetical protein